MQKYKKIITEIGPSAPCLGARGAAGNGKSVAITTGLAGGVDGRAGTIEKAGLTVLVARGSVDSASKAAVLSNEEAGKLL